MSTHTQMSTRAEISTHLWNHHKHLEISKQKPARTQTHTRKKHAHTNTAHTHKSGHTKKTPHSELSTHTHKEHPAHPQGFGQIRSGFSRSKWLVEVGQSDWPYSVWPKSVILGASRWHVAFAVAQTRARGGGWTYVVPRRSLMQSHVTVSNH